MRHDELRPGVEVVTNRFILVITVDKEQANRFTPLRNCFTRGSSDWYNLIEQINRTQVLLKSLKRSAGLNQRGIGEPLPRLVFDGAAEMSTATTRSRPAILDPAARNAVDLPMKLPISTMARLRLLGRLAEGGCNLRDRGENPRYARTAVAR